MYPSTNNSPTTLGLPETLERVGAYLLFWVSGLLLLIFERRNQNVRQHAWQSVVVFGGLSILGFAFTILGGLFGALPVIGLVLGAPFKFLGWLDGVLTIVLWLVLMIGAAVNPHFQLPGTRRAIKTLS
jgi:uncharacterized membrane protein